MGCLEYGMFWTWDVPDVGYPGYGCGKSKIRGIRDVECSGCVMFEIWDGWYVG